MTRMTKSALLVGVLLLWGCSSDSTTTDTPTCPNILVDAGDYWGFGWCQSNGMNFPCCPDNLPSCNADSRYPICVIAARSNAVCGCCEASWTCTW